MTQNHRAGQQSASLCMALFFFGLATFLPFYAEAQNVTRVVIVGDSIMREVSHSLERDLARQPGLSVSSFTSLRPGLSRLDLFDWLGKIDKITRSKKPDIVVIMMGVNDRQPMRILLEDTAPAEEPDWSQDDEEDSVPAFRVIAPESPDWNKEYARRVGAAMDIMLNGGVKKIFWIELPDMRAPAMQRDALLVNTLIQKEAASRPNVIFHPSRKILSRTPGVFTPYIYNTNGMPLQVRDAEGINLDRNGADILARAVISHILETRNGTEP